MVDSVIIEDAGRSSSSGGWSRQRVIFLAISGVVVTALLWWASEVLLPFVLALIIAYVLTPLVARCERAKIPRAVSILLVYFVTFALIYLSISAVAPRIYSETVKLVRDAPAMGQKLAAQWGPSVEDWVQGLLGRSDPPKPVEGQPEEA